MHYKEVSIPLYILAALFLGKETPVHIEWEAGWTPELFRVLGVLNVKLKGRVHPLTGHEKPKGAGWRCVVKSTPQLLKPPPCVRDLIPIVGPMASLDGCRKSRLHQDLIP